MLGNRIGSGRRKHRRATSPAADLLSNLIFVYDLDENTTTGDRLERIVPASYPLVVTGTAATGATGVTGLFDYCYVMNNATSSLATATGIIDTYDTNTALSFSWWFNLNGITPSSSNPFAQLGCYGSSGSSKVWRGNIVQSAGDVYPRMLIRSDLEADVVLTASTPMCSSGDTAWHHILATVSTVSDKMRLYVDGALSEEATWSALAGAYSLKQALSSTYMRVNQFGGGENTKINQAALWVERELGLAEAQALYNSGAGLDYSSWT